MGMKKVLLALFLIGLILPSAFAQNREQKTVCAYFFYSRSCPNCTDALGFIEGKIEPKYPELELKRMKIWDDYELTMGLYEKYGVPEYYYGHVPILFIGDEYFLGQTKIKENIEIEVVKYREKGCSCPDAELCEEKEVSWLNIAGLAAVDAVNPCELAVLVILMTAILSRFPKDRKKALHAGIAFSAAIFMMYLVFGALIIIGFRFVVGITEIGGTWFYTLLGLLAIVLGLLNIKDAIWYGGGGFVMEVPRAWRPRMKAIISGTTSVKGAFVVGLIASFFLTPCTAGPYFVAGGILSGIGLLAALPYLLVYMCIFISPMLVITLITYFGFMAVEDISGWREKNIKRLHWVAGLIMLGIGLAMVFGLIK